MPSVGVKLYSVFFKLLLRHRLQSRIQNPSLDPFGVTSRPEESTAPANPSFADDKVATKDIHIDPLTSLSVRIFLPDPSPSPPLRRNSLPSPSPSPAAANLDPPPRRSSYDAAAPYGGYLPSIGPSARRPAAARRLPVVIQFHGGAFVAGSNASAANDFFCRRIARLCEAIVIAVGYRLAPESRYPAAFEDGLKVLNWLGKQANLAECSKSMGSAKSGGGGAAEVKRSDVHRHIVDTFGASIVEPWLAAHADPSRFLSSSSSCSTTTTTTTSSSFLSSFFI